MSGIAAAAQSAGCCCRPAPNVGCSLQALAPYICGQSERWNELRVQVSGSMVITQQAIPGILPNGQVCECYGGTQIGTASLGDIFLSKAIGSAGIPCSFQWTLRTVQQVGSHSATNSDCYQDGLTCCYVTSPPPCNGFCQQGRFIWRRSPCAGSSVERFAPVCGIANDTVQVCGNCPIGAYAYGRVNEIPASGPVVLASASISIESGFTVDPCGVPTNGTPVRWVLGIAARPYYTCNDEVILGGAGGYTLRYVKPCCSYLDGPEGTYTLDGTYGSSTTQTPCLITQITQQYSQTAVVTEVPS